MPLDQRLVRLVKFEATCNILGILSLVVRVE